MQVSDPFLEWCEYAMFEAEIWQEYKQAQWTGLYLLASQQQVNFALSLLERLILPDERERHYRLELQSASAEYCSELIDEIQKEFERQTAAFNPQKQFIYHCKLD